MIIYYIPLVILIGLAISDLIFGVANDAVNFTNSAIGSRVAPRWVIMLVASVGILIGTIYSSGMLEIARKGVIYPQYFTFDHVITIFLAVMFSDIILLNLFNTYGLPTSTSVSFVFELLGGAVAIGIIILMEAGSDLSQLATFINSDRALLMISGIFISVLFAFTLGAIVQFITRLLFTFRIKKHHRTNVAIWSAFAVAFIFYFILIKGLKGSMLIANQQLTWLQSHTVWFILSFFIVCSIIFLFLIFVLKINPLKIVILTGTFALALAFAANDLVNFIGVPLAGLLSYQLVGFDVNSGSRLMETLNESHPVPVFILIFAGLIMTLTLWFSKKASYVTKTEVQLASHIKGKERFGSSRTARFLVETNLSIFLFIKRLLPSILKKWISKRFQPKRHSEHKRGTNEPDFDLVRASVNLLVASSLISLGTSFKLPLSTTYVTFMVAMGSSISDGAWDRENAASRVNGVLTVIGGWLLTGLLAFSSALILAFFLHYAGTIAIFILILFSVYSIFITHKVFEKRLKDI